MNLFITILAAPRGISQDWDPDVLTIETLRKRYLLPARAYSLIRQEKQTKIQGYTQITM